MKELKYILLLSFSFLHLALLAQNPVTQEISYQYTNDKTWRKVSTIDFDYQGNHLIKETQLFYCDELTSEIIEENEGRKSQTTYSYQNPTNCGTSLRELSAFVLFKH
ncbi:MAG: hypothetical protein AB8G86_24090, partial [Saprospiraceae bacterium]